MRGGETLLEGREVRIAGRQHPEHAGRLQSIPIPDEIVAAFRRQAGEFEA
jgi:hypothetical protein